ncbi:MAG: tRNA uridine-5-carboxymethylaminomethyl(34) synthesis GTPase MnmE [Syntrophomonadaceae bacterium]
MTEDKIAAISTPPGEGGIAIVRLSGKGVIELVKNRFQPFKAEVDLANKQGFTLTLGWILNKYGEKIDEVLVSIMRGPHSYTGEDVVEINCHGGNLPARRCLETLLGDDLRLAQPGEFTRRAFLNGRLDMSQAEAVIDIIRSKTEQGMKLAVKQLEGGIKRYIANLENLLIRANALIEASLDFPEEVGDLDYEVVQGIINDVLAILDKLIASGERNEVYREGISVVICGKPNVGKSSLLNVLVKKERAIVTDIPGTTRDVIEDFINIRGIPVKLMDTAGIRETQDLIEQIGVKKSQQAITEADVIIFLLDAAAGITGEDEDVYAQVKDRNPIILVNKEDLKEKKITALELEAKFPGLDIIRGSVQEETGLDELENLIEERVFSGKVHHDDLEIMINLRQKNCLLKAREHVLNAQHYLTEVTLDCLGVDIWGALESLGEISGKNLKEDVIDRIFHDFCIGK